MSEETWSAGDVALDESCGLILLRADDDRGWITTSGEIRIDGEFVERCHLTPIARSADYYVGKHRRS